MPVVDPGWRPAFRRLHRSFVTFGLGKVDRGLDGLTIHRVLFLTFCVSLLMLFLVALIISDGEVPRHGFR